MNSSLIPRLLIEIVIWDHVIDPSNINIVCPLPIDITVLCSDCLPFVKLFELIIFLFLSILLIGNEMIDFRLTRLTEDFCSCDWRGWAEIWNGSPPHTPPGHCPSSHDSALRYQNCWWKQRLTINFKWKHRLGIYCHSNASNITYFTVIRFPKQFLKIKMIQTDVHQIIPLHR